MTTLRDRAETWPLVIDHLFVLHEPPDPGGPLAAGAPHPDRLSVTGPGGIVLGSAGTDFYPSVSVEAWDGPPPEADLGSWDVTELADLVSRTGEIVVGSIDGASGGAAVRLMSPAHSVVHVHCRGRAAAAERIGRDLFFRGVEEWLIQVSPKPVQQ